MKTNGMIFTVLSLVLSAFFSAGSASADELAIQNQLRQHVQYCEKYADDNNTIYDFTWRATYVRNCLIDRQISVLRSTNRVLRRQIEIYNKHRIGHAATPVLTQYIIETNEDWIKLKNDMRDNDEEISKLVHELEGHIRRYLKELEVLNSMIREARRANQ